MRKTPSHTSQGMPSACDGHVTPLKNPIHLSIPLANHGQPLNPWTSHLASAWQGRKTLLISSNIFLEYSGKHWNCKALNSLILVRSNYIYIVSGKNYFMSCCSYLMTCNKKFTQRSWKVYTSWDIVRFLSNHPSAWKTHPVTSTSCIIMSLSYQIACCAIQPRLVGSCWRKLSLLQCVGDQSLLFPFGTYGNYYIMVITTLW